MKEALSLVWRVFLEYEAPDYTEEGINEFKKTIDDVSWVNARDFSKICWERYHLNGVLTCL